MGTYIDLTVGVVQVDWSKNRIGMHHGALFQECDRKPTPQDRFQSECPGGEELDEEPSERVFSRSLRSMIARLELLGWTIDAIKARFDEQVAEWQEYLADVYEEESVEQERKSVCAPLQFSEFIEFLERFPLSSLSDSDVPLGIHNFNSYMERFTADPAFSRIPNSNDFEGYSEASCLASLIHFLGPYAALRVLALVQANLDAEVVWRYGSLVDSGWAKEQDFTVEARREQTFLIATEGSSDIHILTRAIKLLLPEVHDFFRFIDVSERHPFSGTGSLVKFAEGLVKIDVQNQILFVFDNDAAGWEALDAVRRYTLPSNMRAMALPDIDELRCFEALGPEGIRESDINRHAAAIECYLDLRLAGRPPPRVIWTNYVGEKYGYQGSLEYKDSYFQAFKKRARKGLDSGAYDFTKLRIALDKIFIECCSISSRNKAIKFPEL